MDVRREQLQVFARELLDSDLPEIERNLQYLS